MGFDPVAIFPMTRDCGHFADVYFRVEIGGKGLSMISAIAIDNVERVDFIKMMFLQ